MQLIAITQHSQTARLSPGPWPPLKIPSSQQAIPYCCWNVACRHSLLRACCPTGKVGGERRRRDVLAAAGSNGSGSSAAAPAVPPKWYVTANELKDVPSYMRGRLTLDKVGPVT